MDKLAIKETKEAIIKKYSVVNSIKLFQKVETPLLASKTDCPILASLKKDFGEEFMLGIIQMWIISLNDFINTARKLTASQIEELSLYIYDQYHYLNVSDLYLITKRIKTGYYGNLYESLDGVKILSFFKNYCDERANQNEAEAIRKHDQLKYQEGKDRPFIEEMYFKKKRNK